MLCVSNCAALGLLLMRSQPKQSAFHIWFPNPHMSKLLAPYTMAPRYLKTHLFGCRMAASLGQQMRSGSTRLASPITQTGLLDATPATVCRRGGNIGCR